MLDVLPLDRALNLLSAEFSKLRTAAADVGLNNADGRVLACDVLSDEYVPGFTRSMVDGYAVVAADTFGCSDAVPAMLTMAGESKMGAEPDFCIKRGECAYVPTGGAIPNGADAMVMVEYSEKFCGQTIAISRPSAPANGVVFKGDDVKPGEIVLKEGTRLCAKDIGALAAIGKNSVRVYEKPRIAVFSTGDELVEPKEKPSGGEIRDVNRVMLCAGIRESGGEAVDMGIVPDDRNMICEVMKTAAEKCDMVLLSGGTSVGVKDTACDIMSESGKLLLHGLALKPGKPTVCASVFGKPVFALPGHPVAAYFIFSLVVKPLISGFAGCKSSVKAVEATLNTAIPSNNGREECVAVSLCSKIATPIVTKSGLITTLSAADGYIRIPRDCEGIKSGATVEVYLFER
ncbi:MAG: molybdopterin-binding protein [Oscillospiraceae bacterium]